MLESTVMNERALRHRILWAMGLAAGALAIGAAFPMANPDTYGHLAQGRQIVELGRVPSVDHFSFWKATPQPWHNYEWLSDLVFWFVYAWGGSPLLLAFKVAMAALFGGLLVWAAARRNASRPDLAAWSCAALLLLALPALRVRLTVRPHMFGYVLAAILLIGLGWLLNAGDDPASRKQARRWIVGLALTHLAWVNLHGSHLLGPVLSGLHLAAAITLPTQRKRIGTLLALQLGVSCVSPFGPSILLDAVEHVVRPEYRQLVSEWSAWSAGYSPYYMVTIVICGLLVAALAIPMWRSGADGKAALFTTALLGVMAARSLRFHVDFLALSAPLLGAAFSQRIQEHRLQVTRRVVIAVTLLAAMAAGPVAAQLPPHLGFGFGHSEALLPAASGRFLHRHAPKARVLAAIDDAWYLMFAAPKAKFLVDGRVPFYGSAHVRRVSAALASKSVLMEVLEHHDVNVVVIEFAARGQQQAIMALRQDPAWRMVWIEDHHVLFARVLPEWQNWLARFTLQGVLPAYAPDSVFDSGTSLQAIRRDLTQLSQDRNSATFVAWMRALLLLHPLARDKTLAGLRAPQNAKERQQAAQALALLDRVTADIDYVPIVHAYHAMAALAACQTKKAKRALERARSEGDNRESLLTEIELWLRTGDIASVKRQLSRAEQMPQAATDPWLAAIRRDLTSGVRCQ